MALVFSIGNSYFQFKEWPTRIMAFLWIIIFLFVTTWWMKGWITADDEALDKEDRSADRPAPSHSPDEPEAPTPLRNPD